MSPVSRRVLKINIGVNIGNQDTKSIGAAGKDCFSSLATYNYKKGLNSNDYTTDPNMIILDEKKCLVGIGNPSYGDFQFRNPNELKVLGVYAIVKQLMKREDRNLYGIVEVEMCVGLPIKEYKEKENHDKLREIFSESVNIKYLDLDFELRFKKLIIAPEGFAFYAAFKEEHKYADYRKILVLDFGSRTIDTVDIVNGTAVTPYSIPERGTISLMDRIREGGVNIENIDFDIMFKEGQVDVGGVTYSIDKYKEEIEEYAFNSHQAIIQKYGDLKAFQKIILIGGGSYLVQELFTKYYEGIVEIVEDAEFANAEAYYELSYLES